ncbi:hypothetical protein BTHI11S_01673 [Bosea thiooxidans]
MSAYGVALWFLWAAGLLGMFWIAVFVTSLPKAISIGKAAVGHLLRPIEGAASAPIRHNIAEVCLQRGVRLVILIAATFWLAHIWHVDLVGLTNRDNLLMRLLRGALASVVILLLADFVWQIITAAVDGTLADPVENTAPGSNEAIRRARLRTLLPIFRNVLFVAIAVIAGLTALAALGFEIGPLIAGAGVLRSPSALALDTPVRDIISGMFYLLDDAFRVGEYIQSGSFKGTVKSFSLRSVRLRHHRGPVFTVPFGQLGAIQNISRDWVIDKFMINVTYDSDLEKARKISKKVGQELLADPELAPDIIEPMKMQGVEQFGDYAIQLRFKMTTGPASRRASVGRRCCASRRRSTMPVSSSPIRRCSRRPRRGRRCRAADHNRGQGRSGESRSGRHGGQVARASNADVRRRRRSIVRRPTTQWKPWPQSAMAAWSVRLTTMAT